MKCPKCENEMREGFLFSTKDGAFSFADEVPSVIHNASKAPGFVKITPVKPNHRVHVAAYCCTRCRLVQFEF